MEIVIGLIALVIGLLLGQKIADIDLKLPLTKHRSSLTHGLIFPSILFFLTTPLGHDLLGQGLSNVEFAVYQDVLKYFTSGFCITYAIHLAFDMYPKKWHGNAKVVFLGFRSPGWFSWLWLGLGVLASLLVILLLATTDWEWIAAGVLMFFSFFEMNKKEEKTVLPLLTLIGLAWLSFSLWEVLVDILQMGLR